MSYSFEYIDIILLAMIAGFIFLRLRGILGKKTGFEEDIDSSFAHEAPPVKQNIDLNANTFDENAKKEFVKGARIAYETIITNFANGKLKDIKSLLDKNVYHQFEEAIKDQDFLDEYAYYCKHYIGRPSPLYYAENLTKNLGGAKILFKQEHLNHTNL